MDPLLSALDYVMAREKITSMEEVEKKLKWCKTCEVETDRTKCGSCKSCNKRRAKQWAADNPELKKLRDKAHYERNRVKVQLTSKRWRKENPGKFIETNRRWNLAKKYNMTLERYDGIIIEQGGGCAICGRKQGDTQRWFPVDHCHTTGKIRGILCFYCNTALGKFNDDPELMLKAIAYVIRSREPS